MDTVRLLLANPVFSVGLALLFIVLFIRLGRLAYQRNQDFLFVLEMALALALVVLAAQQVHDIRKMVSERALFEGQLQNLGETLQKQEAQIALLEGEAKAAQQKLDKMVEETGWREITEAQAHEFATFVWSPKGKVHMAYIIDDQEVAKYAVELGKMLRRGGYDAPEDLRGMIPLSPMGNGPTIVGVKISVNAQENAMAGALQQNLKRVGVDIRGRLDTAQAEDTLIIVGRRSL